jgi:hypothetical protein
VDNRASPDGAVTSPKRVASSSESLAPGGTDAEDGVLHQCHAGACGGAQPPAEADMIMTGRIEKFKKDNRAARYMMPGLGAASIKAHVELRRCFVPAYRGKSDAHICCGGGVRCPPPKEGAKCSMLVLA